MYRANELWDDAVRVAKLHGGVNASKKVAYAWAVSLGGEAGAKLLTKFGLVEQAIDYATESGAFDHAFSLASASKKEKLPEVHLKFAMFLEDEGRFEEAEKEFVKADKPKEAIEMCTHLHDWANATRIAEANDPASIPEVLTAQAKVCVERGAFTKAEALYVRAKKPELAVKAYKEAQVIGRATATITTASSSTSATSISHLLHHPLLCSGGTTRRGSRASSCRTGWVSCRPSTRRTSEARGRATAAAAAAAASRRRRCSRRRARWRRGASSRRRSTRT